MEDFSKSTISNVLEYLLIALRYIASGFVAMAVYAYFYMPEYQEIKDLGGSLILVAATIGIITYALHFATMDKIFNGCSIQNFLDKNKLYLPEILKKQIYDWDQAKGESGFITKEDNTYKLNYKKYQTFFNHKIKRKILFALSNQAYLRSLSNNQVLVSMQKQLEKRLALLNFLYCAFYQLVIIDLYYLLSNIPFCKGDADFFLKFSMIIIVAIIFIFSVRRFNNRICEREMWMAENYGQNIEKLVEERNGEEKRLLTKILTFFEKKI